MASFLTALANIGSQYAEGTTAGKEEKEKLAQEKARTGLEQTQQELERQRLNMTMQQLAQYKAEAPLRELQMKADLAKAKYYDIYDAEGKRRTVDVSTGKLVSPEDQGLADPAQAANFQQAQAYISGQPKDLQAEMNRRLTFGYATREPWDKIRTSLEAMVDKYNAKGGGAGAGELIGALPQATEGNWDPDVQARFLRRAQLAQYSKNPSAEIDKAFTEADNTQKQRTADKAKQAKETAKGQELTAGASKAIMTTLPTLASVNDMLKDIDRTGLGTNNQNGYFTMAYLKYRAGIRPPVNTLKDDIAGFSLGSVTEAVSALQGATRAYAALQLAMIHTPNPLVDSPAQVKGKLENIRTRLNRIVAFARIYGTKGATPPLDQALRMVGTPENEIQSMMRALGPGPSAGVPAPVAPAQTDVPAAPAAGGLSPAAQAVLDSYQKKPPAGRQ